MTGMFYSSIGNACRLRLEDSTHFAEYSTIARHYGAVHDRDTLESTNCLLFHSSETDHVEDVATLFRLAAKDRMVYLFGCYCDSPAASEAISAEIEDAINNDDRLSQWVPIWFGKTTKYVAFVRH
jgi:hypothetical protein